MVIERVDITTAGSEYITYACHNTQTGKSWEEYGERRISPEEAEAIRRHHRSVVRLRRAEQRMVRAYARGAGLLERARDWFYYRFRGEYELNTNYHPYRRQRIAVPKLVRDRMERIKARRGIR